MKKKLINIKNWSKRIHKSNNKKILKFKNYKVKFKKL